MPPPAATQVAAGLLLRVTGPRATVTLAPRPAGGMNPVPVAALADVGRRLAGEVRVLVLDGEPGAFALSSEPLAGPDPAGRIETAQAAIAWLAEPRLISVAAVTGPATGPGVQLALACDLRIVADDATFAVTEVADATVPGLGGTSALVATVGYARALELCLTGRAVAPGEAVRLGLAELAVPPDRLADAVDDLVAALLAAPPGAVAETKALLRAAAAAPPAGAQLAAERAAHARCLAPDEG